MRRRKERGSKPDFAFRDDMLMSYEQGMHLAAQFWTSSNALFKYVWCGNHMADTYSNCGLRSDLYGSNFTLFFGVGRGGGAYGYGA